MSNAASEWTQDQASHHHTNAPSRSPHPTRLFACFVSLLFFFALLSQGLAASAPPDDQADLPEVHHHCNSHKRKPKRWHSKRHKGSRLKRLLRQRRSRRSRRSRRNRRRNRRIRRRRRSKKRRYRSRRHKRRSRRRRRRRRYKRRKRGKRRYARRRRRRRGKRRRRRRRRRRRWRRRKRAFTQKRLKRWKQLLVSMREAVPYLNGRELHSMRRSLRWKTRLTRRKYKGVPASLYKELRAFSRRLRRLSLVRKRLKRRYRRNKAQYARLSFMRRRRPSHRKKVCSTTLTKKGLRLISSTHCKRRKLKKYYPRRRMWPFYWPAKSRYIASPFGWRKGPFSGRKGFHSGADIAAKYGAPIFAAASGKVVRAGWFGGCGLAIYIYHKNGIQTGYCHLSKIKVFKGSWVRRGQMIGQAGSTGSATASHLHFTVQRRRRYINPGHFLRGKWRPKRRRRRRRKRRHKHHKKHKVRPSNKAKKSIKLAS